VNYSRAISALTTVELENRKTVINNTDYKDETGTVLSSTDGTDGGIINSSLEKKRNEEIEKLESVGTDFKISSDDSNFNDGVANIDRDITGETNILSSTDENFNDGTTNIDRDIAEETNILSSDDESLADFKPSLGLKTATINLADFLKPKKEYAEMPTGIISNDAIANYRDSASLVGRDTDFMLLNFIPYAVQDVASVAQDIMSFDKDKFIDNGVQNTINAVQYGIALWDKFSTYSTFETAKMFLQNAFTLMYIPGMKDFSVKIKQSLFSATPYEGKVTNATLGFGSKGDDQATGAAIAALITKYKADRQMGMKMHIYLDGETASNISIPFQFTPTISESGRAAKFEATSMLHRQGSIFSYVGSEHQTLTLETEFITLSNEDKKLTYETVESFKAAEKDTSAVGKWLNKNVVDTAFGSTVKDIVSAASTGVTELLTIKDIESDPEQSFYQFWTYSRIHAIELGLRALVLPKVDDNGGVSRPPIIKIQMGGIDGLYSMLSYPSGDKNYLRTYVVTKVTITKDLKESPILYLANAENNKDGGIDTIGYKVSMELSELDSSIITDEPGPTYSGYFNEIQAFLSNNKSWEEINGK